MRGGKIIAALYEYTTMEGLKAAKQNLRNLINDLKSTLHGIGMDDILIRKGSTLAIRPERLDCDYYRMQDKGCRIAVSYAEEVNQVEIMIR